MSGSEPRSMVRSWRILSATVSGLAAFICDDHPFWRSVSTVRSFRTVETLRLAFRRRSGFWSAQAQQTLSVQSHEPADRFPVL